MRNFFERNERALLWTIFALALGLRIAYQLFLQHHYFFVDAPSSDVGYYQDWARQIADGDWLGNKTFYGLPLYPYFLAVLLRLTLGNMTAVHLAFSLLGAGNCLLLYFVGRALFSRGVAAGAAFLMAVNFLLIYYDWLLMPVTLIITLTLLILYSLLHPESMPRRRHWFFLGLLFGLATLADGKFLFFLGMTALALFWKSGRPRRSVLAQKILPLVLGAALVLGLVTVRNKVVGGDWTFISAQSGLSLYAGNNPDASGTYDHPNFLRPTHGGQDADQRIIAEQIAKKRLSPGEISAFWRGQALRFIREQPGAYLRLLARKGYVFFQDTEQAHDIDLLLQGEWRHHLDLTPFWLICPLALLGAGLAWRAVRPARWLILLVASQWLMTMIFFLQTRHRATILPVLLLLAAYAVAVLLRRWQDRDYRFLLTAAGMVGVVILIVPPRTADPEFVRFIRDSKAGRIYEQRGDYAKAKEFYLRVLDIRPRDTTILYNLGNAYLLNGEVAAAQEYYLRALQTCHYNVDAVFNLAYTYEQQGDLDQALRYYTEVLEYEPDSPDIHFRLAGILGKQGRCPEALVHYRMIAAQNPALADQLASLISFCRPPQ